jgi:hypothetical protein
VLIPTIGSRAITYCFAATLLLCGALLLGMRKIGMAGAVRGDG